MIIKEIFDRTDKEDIARFVLRDLPEWFGIEESTAEYINDVHKYSFIVALIDNEPVGFYSLREENHDVLDMYVLGVLKKYHNQGVGSNLQEYAEKYAEERGYKYLMVLTLAEKVKNPEYLLTRKFYQKMGFIDLYQNDKIFDEYNPCQLMIKRV